jgi:hypothetical protein
VALQNSSVSVNEGEPVYLIGSNASLRGNGGAAIGHADHHHCDRHDAFSKEVDVRRVS